MAKPILDNITSRLNELSEQYLLDVIDQDAYAFGVHDLLGEIPTPCAPAHIPVLHCIKFWKETQLIAAEQATMLLQRVVAASKEGVGAAGASGQAEAMDVEEPPPLPAADVMVEVEAPVPPSRC